MYVRNLSFNCESSSPDAKRLGIRPKRLPGDFLEAYIPNNISFLFKGQVSGKYFNIYSVF